MAITENIKTRKNFSSLFKISGFNIQIIKQSTDISISVMSIEKSLHKFQTHNNFLQ